MKKKIFIAITALAIMCILFIVGLSLIFSAHFIGENAKTDFIRSQGGVVFGDISISENIVKSCQIGGLAMSLVGGSGILLSSYMLYKEM